MQFMDHGTVSFEESNQYVYAALDLTPDILCNTPSGVTSSFCLLPQESPGTGKASNRLGVKSDSSLFLTPVNHQDT